MLGLGRLVTAGLRSLASQAFVVQFLFDSRQQSS
jgi:hypothetical protein